MLLRVYVHFEYSGPVNEASFPFFRPSHHKYSTLSLYRGGWVMKTGGNDDVVVAGDHVVDA